MDVLIQLLIDWGYWGLFISSLLAGSVIPFSSELVLATLIHPSIGLNPLGCLICATTGNMLGGLTCYWMGRFGKIEWIEKYFHIKQDKVRKMQIYLHNKSAFMAFFVFLPILGSIIAIALGFLRSNIVIVSISMLLGKILRYLIIMYTVLGLFSIL